MSQSYYFIVVLRWRDIQQGANCVQWFFHQPGLRMHQPRLKAYLRLETQRFYCDVNFTGFPWKKPVVNFAAVAEEAGCCKTDFIC